VLTQSPHPALPWPSQGRALPPLAPPLATRPPTDIWLSSSCMRVLDLTLTAAPPSSSRVSPSPASSSQSSVTVASVDGDAHLVIYNPDGTCTSDTNHTYIPD
jgi:hypothetical protein